MALINKPTEDIMKGGESAFSIDKTALAALIPDTYFSNPENWKTITLHYKDGSGTQRPVIIFDAGEPLPESILALSERAKSAFEVTAFVIHDFDEDNYVVKRSMIPNVNEYSFTAKVMGALKIFHAGFLPVGTTRPNIFDDPSSPEHFYIGTDSTGSYGFKDFSSNPVVNASTNLMSNKAIMLSEPLIMCLDVLDDGITAYVMGEFGTRFLDKTLPEQTVGTHRILKLNIEEGTVEDVIDVPPTFVQTTDAANAKAIKVSGNVVVYKSSRIVAIDLQTKAVIWNKPVSANSPGQAEGSGLAHYKIECDAAYGYTLAHTYDGTSIGFQTLIKFDLATGTLDSEFHAPLVGEQASIGQQVHTQQFVKLGEGKYLATLGKGGYWYKDFAKFDGESFSLHLGSDLGLYNTPCMHLASSDKLYTVSSTPSATSTYKVHEINPETMTYVAIHLGGTTVPYTQPSYIKPFAVAGSSVYMADSAGHLGKFDLSSGAQDSEFKLVGTSGLQLSEFPKVVGEEVFFFQWSRGPHFTILNPSDTSVYSPFLRVSTVTGEVVGEAQGHFLGWPKEPIPTSNGKIIGPDNTYHGVAAYTIESYGWQKEEGWPTRSAGSLTSLAVDGEYAYALSTNGLTLNDSEGSVSGFIHRINMTTKLIDRSFAPVISEDASSPFSLMEFTSGHIYLKNANANDTVKLSRIDKSTFAVEHIDLVSKGISDGTGKTYGGNLAGNPLSIIERADGKLVVFFGRFRQGSINSTKRLMVYDHTTNAYNSFVVVDATTFMVEERHHTETLLSSAYNPADNCVYALTSASGSTQVTAIHKYNINTLEKTQVFAFGGDSEYLDATDLVLKDGKLYLSETATYINRRRLTGVVRFNLDPFELDVLEP